MSVHDFIAKLAQHDITLQVDGERLILNAPKGAMTEGLAAEIRNRKAELLAFLSDTDTRTIPQVSRTSALPLSFSQQRLWFLDQLDEGSSVYNVPSATLIQGQLDRAILVTVVQALIARHEVLRTVFGAREGQPYQRILPELVLEVPIIDLRAEVGEANARLAAGELPQLPQIETLIARAAETPFDLAHGPLLRVELLILADDAHVLTLNVHHIVADGWSMEVFLSDFVRLYTAAVAGQPSPLAPLPIQYADFACWQRDHLKGVHLERQQQFWRERLSGLPPLLELPTDKPRPAYQSFAGAHLQVDLPEPLVAALARFAQDHEATQFMTLLSVFYLWMARLSGFDDIAVGTPVNNREREELAGLMGFFSNTLVLRGQLKPNQSFRELVRATRTQLVAAYSHQDLPFEHLVDLLEPERHMSYSPLFQVMFTLRKSALAETRTTDWQVRNLPLNAKTSKFDLTLNLTEDEGQIKGFLEYNTALFEEATMRRWFGYFTTLAEQALAHPDAAQDTLQMLPSRERDQLLRGWNDTARNYGAAHTIHALFEAQVARTADAEALIYDGRRVGESVAQLSFAELNARANRVAHRLLALGVGPETCVGLCLPRSVEMVVAMLGILKAGGTYVPLDPAYPAERLAYMLRDAGIRLILTAASQEAVYGGQPVTPLLMEREDFAAWPDSDPAVPMDVDNLLYLTYTSGSTGRPKGIALSHRALVNLIDWHIATLAPGRTLQFASMSFDASYHEIFAAWCVGEALLVVPEELRYDFAALPELLHQHRIAKAILPVVVLQQWAEFYPDGSQLLEHLRDIITTGEQLQVTRPIVRLFQHLPQARLHNHYGPAETHVVTAYSFAANPEGWSYHAPIGYPIANSTIYILDVNLEPVPQGVKGDLYIGGTNLARGYLGKPDKSAEKFVPHPFLDGGERLYKTGDLARWLPGGKIEFLGRSDHMIKLRGYRIEPGEVEVALTADSRVNRAVVVVKGQGSDRRLVAYLILHEPIADAAEVLRARLARSLPDYMIPSAFVVLERLPLTPSGKVDARLLPDPDFSGQSAQPIVAPRGETERRLLEIWAELLNLAPNAFGVEHNFFRLGGHSLLATRVASRLRHELSIDLPLRLLFTHPTIAGLAIELDNLQWLAKGSATAADSAGEAFEEEL